MLRSVFTDPQSFFDLAILSIFFKILIFQGKLIIHFYKINYQLIYQYIDNEMLYQKNYKSAFNLDPSPTYGLNVGGL